MENKNPGSGFKPYVPADKIMPEFTATSIIMGILLAVVFGAANAYLGLRVGMTVSASIPAAVISMGVIRLIMKKDSILENNMVQTIGSAGESLAAGAIFTLPAVFMWVAEGTGTAPNFLTIALVCISGGLLGVVFMVPLRSALIVKEHGVLPYPEGTACAEVLMAGEEGGTAASTVFWGLGIAAIYKFIADGIKLFPSEADWAFKKYDGSGIGMDVLPALAGVGFICGPVISSYMLAGGVTAWFIIMPMIKAFGGNMVMFPSTVPISEMDTWAIWSSYVRYIGAGAVAAGGIMSLIKSLPIIIRTFRESMGSLRNKDGVVLDLNRTNKDLDMKWLGLILLIVLAILIFVPSIPMSFGSAIIIIIFGFFFATVSSRMVGLVGSSNNPVSGMAIATLLIATILLKATGTTGPSGMVTAIMIGTVICIIAAMAGDMSQDLKTGYIVGATPYRQQIGEIIGTISSGLAIAGVLYLLNAAWGYGSKELPAPQASLMKMVIEGVMNANLPWTLVFVGVFFAVIIEILGIPVLPVAIGLYLPIHLSTPLMVGGLVKLWFEKRSFKNEQDRNNVITSGVLYSSGMIAGEGIVGILLALFAIIPVQGGTVGTVIDISAKGISFGNIGALICFAILVLTLLKWSIWNKKVYTTYDEAA
ncbi:OPT family oligopeptide transporter [Hornefia butyriciproducens]|jgi:putative OPT family oligopeptide transporter|uniref:OPT family oligopeptide transporter n=1 Tax=Hornefia butyriciproducens TaxID=2652293 RepID=UPI0023F096CC|nr:oligopeptide transporter, OPT family [Hornefia butyriciproducens]MCI7412143.1 oligopeptide transporter, OPT family [Clostridiales bacterium]MDD6299384.1 oligopeptide transporter, OPT family [Hornefia butyriciproducens]MDY5463221.1 oligopeptide transporter, OPT family [Hornefia butyriciproducens]MDY6212639.1 oligopeptide transporter, OPT family [Hornefia butyriciproducens]